MKVLRIIARLNVGGPARHVVWLTDGLTKHGYETLLITGIVPPAEADMTYLAAPWGITPLVVPEMSRELSLKDLLSVWKLFRLMRRERPNIVHTHTAKAGAVGRTAGLIYRWSTPRADCRFVHTYHGHIFHGYYGSLKTRLFLMIERLLARVATDCIVVVSEQQRNEINQVFGVGRKEQFRVIPLGIETEQYAHWREHGRTLRGQLHASDSEILVGIVGRLTEVKNHRLFLEAAAKYNTMGNNIARVRFVIVGDGHLRNELETRARTVGLSPGVVFLGTRKDPEDFYPAFDIVALTSVNEGTPLTLIEAMANARPVIATAVGGVVDLLGAPTREELAHGGFSVCERGVSVKSGDAEGFAHGLKYLIENPDVRDELGHRGLDFVLHNHTKERLVQDVATLYNELANHLQAASPARMGVRSPTSQDAQPGSAAGAGR